MIYKMVLIIALNIISLSGMELYQGKQDELDNDYNRLIPYIVQMFERTANTTSPFGLLQYFTQPGALIHSEVPCTYQSVQDYIWFILRTQKLRMASEYTKQAQLITDERELSAWFINYFKTQIAPRVLQDLKKERDQKYGSREV